MPTLATLFCAILADMRAALGAFMSHRHRGPAAVWLGTRAFVAAQTRPATPAIPMDVLALAWTRLGRLAQRFARLYAQWKSNTLPKPRPSRAGKPRAARAAKPYFPTMRAWLATGTDHHIRSHASQLAHLLAAPDATEFLCAVPQAGRILRPLCHMLGIDVPTPIVLPPKPRAPRQRAERPPLAPLRHGKYTPAQTRRYRPGRIPKTFAKLP